MAENASGKKMVGYFANWGIYDRDYHVQQIPHQNLTHIIYSFENIDRVTGEVSWNDLYADTERHYPSDSWDEEGFNLYGNLKQLYLLKKKNRKPQSSAFDRIVCQQIIISKEFKVANEEWRRTFVDSACELVKDSGLDGLDIDYEYPTNDSETQGYVDLLRELRARLDKTAILERKTNGQYQLTVVASCGMDTTQIMKIKEMDHLVDFWNLQAFDFSGSWSAVADHQANLYPANPEGASIVSAVQYYRERGVEAYKLVLGMPLHGKVFAQTDGIGEGFNGPGELGSWEPGIYDYKALPLNGSTEINLPSIGASWSHDLADKTIISYDTPIIAKQKAEYINEQGLGGAMFWRLDGDAAVDTKRSILKIVKDTVGALEQRENSLNYPASKHDNLRQGMFSRVKEHFGKHGVH